MDGFVDMTSEMDIVLLIGSVGILIITMALFRRGRARLPPGPRRWPALGNLPQLGGDRMFYEKLNDLREQHGDIVYLTLGSLKVLVVYGHELVKEVVIQKDDDFKYRPQWLIEIQKLELFNGMVWSNGDCNHILRKFTQPILCPGLGDKTLEQRVQDEAKHVLNEIAKMTGEPTNLMNLFKRAIFNINYSIVFGSRGDYSDPDFLLVISLMDQLLQRQGIKNPLNFFPILRKLPQGRKARQSKDVMDKIKAYIKGRIDKARETYSDKSVRSLLDLYIQTCSNSDPENTITDDTICHIARDLFVAGSENVAIALQWLIAYMVKYPEIQTKCRKLILSQIALDHSLSLSDVKKLPFVEATIKEVLRLANIAPLSVPHATVKEVEFHGYNIPKDTMVLTHLESVHMDPKYWECPTEFRPERFLENGSVIAREAYYPFSLGSRCCPADKLAMMEIFVILCECLRKYSFKLPDDTDNISLEGVQPGAFVEPPPFDVCCVLLK